MKLYHFEPITKFLSYTDEAYLDPLETKIQGKNIYMQPAYSTFTKPPKTKANQLAQYDPETDDWNVIPDYRGMWKVNETMSPEPIYNYGELPNGYIPITQAQATKILEDPLYYIIQDDKLIVNPDYDAQKFAIAKQNKYFEALNKANEFINTSALFEFDENNHIEATDGNIAKFTAYALGLSTGATQKVYWTTKEDNVIELNANDVQTILTGLGQIQSDIWNVQFVSYKNAIDNAQTLEQINNIEVNYVI